MKKIPLTENAATGEKIQKYNQPPVDDRAYRDLLRRKKGDSVYVGICSPLIHPKYVWYETSLKREIMISGEEFLEKTARIGVCPHPLFRESVWDELVKRKPTASNKDLIPYFIYDDDVMRRGISLFDFDYYRNTYEKEIGNESPVYFFLTKGMFENHHANPFLIDRSFWSEFASRFLDYPAYDASTGKALLFWVERKVKIRGIWPVYGSRDNVLRANPLKTLDAFLSSRPYSEWGYLLLNNEFDKNYYRETNLDLASMSDSDLEKHYSDFGKKEGRPGSFNDLLNSPDVAFNALYEGFLWQEYRNQFSDLKHFDKLSQIITHFVKSGHREARVVAKSLPLLRPELYQNYVQYSNNGIASEKIKKYDISAKLYFHIYYEDEIENYLPVLRSAESLGIPIYISSANGLLSVDSLDLLSFASPKIILTRNEGRDIGGYKQLLPVFPVNDDDAVILMHTKKSPHISESERKRWVSVLLHAIGESPANLNENVLAFSRQKDLQMIGSMQTLFIDNGGRNKGNIALLMNRLKLPPSLTLAPFNSGTMGLYRGKVINDVFSSFSSEELDRARPDDLAYNMDGQFAHAVERVLGSYAAHLGKVIWR